MTPKLKLALIIGIAVAIVGFIVLDQPNMGLRQGSPSDEQGKNFSLVEPTGDTEALIEDVLLEAEAEEAVLIQEDSDALFLDSDLETVNQLGESYAEDDF